MRNLELLETIHKEFEERFYELGQYCFTKETVTLNYHIGRIILEYDYN